MHRSELTLEEDRLYLARQAKYVAAAKHFVGGWPSLMIPPPPEAPHSNNSPVCPNVVGETSVPNAFPSPQHHQPGVSTSHTSVSGLENAFMEQIALIDEAKQALEENIELQSVSDDEVWV